MYFELKLMLVYLFYMDRLLCLNLKL